MISDSFINNALRQYNRKKISYFESILKEEKILKERIGILENYFKQNFNYEKSSEYIRDIFTFELIAVSAVSKTDIIETDIKAGIKSIRSILDFHSANPDLLKDFLLLLAKYAISDLYYFLNTYWFHKHKKQFQFRDDFTAACHELRTIIENQIPIQNFLKLFFSRQEQTEKFFIKTNDKTGYTIDDVIFRDFYDRNLESDSDAFFSPETLSRTIEKMTGIYTEMESHFKLLLTYYDSAGGKPFRYNLILENLNEKKNNGIISDVLLNEFTEYNNAFSNYHELVVQRGLVYFGFQNFPYKNIIILQYKYSKLLEFILLRKGQYDRLNTHRDSVLKNLEKRLISINQAD
ncbi:MAG: hypothetical protein JW982_11645 [Spirochaetes bacterium]|nr:hypothetical protein [Spirochaetota bacterium]